METDLIGKYAEFLKNIPSSKAYNLAIMLESQNLSNSVMLNLKCNYNVETAESFKRCSLKIAKFMALSPLFELVGIQPMMGATSLCYWLSNDAIKSEEISARTEMFNRNISFPTFEKIAFGYKNIKSMLQIENEISSVIALEINCHFFSKITKILTEKADLQLENITIDKAINEMKNNSDITPNFVVGNGETILKMFKNCDPLKLKIGIDKVTNHNNISYYYDSKMNPDTILIGRKCENIFDNGFVFMPYIPIVPPMETQLPDELALATRYAMKLTNSKYYCAIKTIKI